MFKLIESNRREVARVWNNERLIWRQEKELIRSERLELFNEVRSITIFNVGYDWDILEINDVEIYKVDGKRISRDFSVTNSKKVEAIKNSIGLLPYRMAYYNVRKFRGGVG
ncbi:hypothetical protein [Dolosigranulum savutiense]|uniref:Uncharacterized protein n=1 Tax=Dolosigranulum savutiense TaxID=3110288 RepID=A0AB74TWY4_9LACT